MVKVNNAALSLNPFEDDIRFVPDSLNIYNHKSID